MPVNISTIYIHAPVQHVWKALTEPALVKQWQYGSDIITNWTINSEIRFRTVWEDKVFEQWGKVLEIKPNALIRYSLFAPAPGREDKPENYFIMNYTLTEEGDRVKLEIIQEDDRPGAKQEAPQGEENPILQALKKVAESIK